MSEFHIRTVAEDEALPDRISRLEEACWPPYMLYAPLEHQDAEVGWKSLHRRFPDLIFGVLDQDDRLVAAGHCVPIWEPIEPDALPDTGWDWALSQALEGEEKSHVAAASALAICVDKSVRGKGVATVAIRAMMNVVRKRGARTLFAPVRPVLKHSHPEVDIDEFVTWTTENGDAFDPWIRVHLQLGGRILKTCRRSMTMTAPLEKWREWTGHGFGAEQTAVVPGLLVPMQVNHAEGIGNYVEPNVWIEHRLPE